MVQSRVYLLNERTELLTCEVPYVVGATSARPGRPIILKVHPRPPTPFANQGTTLHVPNTVWLEPLGPGHMLVPREKTSSFLWILLTAIPSILVPTKRIIDFKGSRLHTMCASGTFKARSESLWFD